MTKLGEALRKKYKTPKDALLALGLDESLLGESAPNRASSGLQMENLIMKKNVKLSRTAIMAKGALAVVLQPRLAQDAKIDLNPLVSGVTPGNWGASKVKMLGSLRKLPEKVWKDKLAMDATIEEVKKALTLLDSVMAQDDSDSDLNGANSEVSTGTKGQDSPVDDILALLQGKISDEDMAAVQQLLQPEAGAGAGAGGMGDGCNNRRSEEGFNFVGQRDGPG